MHQTENTFVRTEEEFLNQSYEFFLLFLKRLKLCSVKHIEITKYFSS